MHPSSIPKSANQDTFESGARAMTEAVNAGGISAYFADSADPLHAAFKAKAVIHSGPGGMPLMGEAAQKRLSELWEEPRSGKGLAYFHVPFCETRCLYCLFYQNPFKEDASREYARRLIREIELWSDRAAQNSGLIHAVYFGGGTPTALLSEDLKAVLKAVHEHLPLANDCEITLEGRIHHFEDAKMEAALAGGVNRFSLGVQTLTLRCDSPCSAWTAVMPSSAGLKSSAPTITPPLSLTSFTVFRARQWKSGKTTLPPR
ncbi:MAG: radical SAM protein [Duodenibacillus massiliensis]